MKVLNDLLFNEDLKIYQDTDLGTYTFDSILLTNFITLKKKTKNIVDLCSGNAPIAMILAHKLRKKEVKVVSVEIQRELSMLALESVKQNKLVNIEIINADLKGISETIGKNKYQIVSVNPPYFKYDATSNLKDNEKIAIARHEIKVTIEDIIEEAKKLLDNEGSLYLVFRPQRLDELLILLDKYKFVTKRLQLVYPKDDQRANTILIEASKKSGDNQMIVEKPIIVYDEDGNYTETAKAILKI